jgi:hypothetical protein
MPKEYPTEKRKKSSMSSFIGISKFCFHSLDRRLEKRGPLNQSVVFADSGAF